MQFMAKKTLNSTQRQLMDLLKENPHESYTIREFQEILNLSTTSLVHHHLKQLEKNGFIKKNPHKSSSYIVLGETPEKVVAYLPLFGHAQCGPDGEMLDDQIIEHIPVPTKILNFPSSDGFLVEAKGDSMLPRIHEGDFVIAKKANRVDNGTLAVCVYDDETLIKKIQYDEQTILLLSLNPSYSPILVRENLRIVGEVKNILSQSF